MKLYKNNIKIKTIKIKKNKIYFQKAIKIDSKIRYHNFGVGERVLAWRVVGDRREWFQGWGVGSRGEVGVQCGKVRGQGPWLARGPLKVGVAASSISKILQNK